MHPFPAMYIFKLCSFSGPISVTVYIKMDNLKNFMNKFQQRSNVLLHLVPAKGVSMVDEQYIEVHAIYD